VPKGDFVGEFELYVMLAIAHLGDDAYGIAVRQAIEVRTGREIAIGAVYATLGRLEDKRLVRHDLSDPQPVAGGRARKIFALTPDGQRALRHSATMMTRMMAGLVLKPTKGRAR
jgi:DNA-binding PadR family transcriptional regulator